MFNLDLRKSTVASFVVAIVAVATIAVSAGSVLTKNYPPRLAVEVKGVPGYVYYHRDYDVTIQYANLGREPVPAARVEAWIPAGFTVDGVSLATSDEPQRFVWEIGGLSAGQRGEIPVTIRGTLPADLTRAVYDLPGYVGHTAFVDGFRMEVTLTSGGGSANQVAVADTGAPIQCTQVGQQGCFYFTKLTGLDDGTLFEFEITIPPGAPVSTTLEDGQSFGILIPPSPATITVTERTLPGWVLGVDEPSCDGNGVLVQTVPRGITISDDPQSDLVPQFVCNFTNVRVPLDGCEAPGLNYIAGYICVFKQTDDQTDQVFSFDVVADAAPAAAATETLQTGERFFVQIPPSGGTTRVEEIVPDGWILDSVLCIAGNATNVTTVDATGLTISGTGDEFAGGWCVFYNVPEEIESTPEPSHPERTVPNIGAGLSGLFNGQPTPLPTAPPATAPSTGGQAIRPPNTGDAGLK